MPLPIRVHAVTLFRLAMLVLAALILFHWKLGPVVVSFGSRGSLLAGHGIHAGDPVALIPSLAALPLRRIRALRLDRRLGVRRPLSPNPARRAADQSAA